MSGNKVAIAREERAAVVAWLRADAGMARADLTRLHAARKLTPSRTAEWEGLIALKIGIAGAIERGENRSAKGGAPSA
ncbi:MAG TPA: hypothetical protein VF503_12275 [Sphingobium sp.]|uniref:hypothetical protein n=1 Tax=Sphingobium sp. TaxID=1912891 RepID=UPI002ED0228F